MEGDPAQVTVEAVGEVDRAVEGAPKLGVGISKERCSNRGRNAEDMRPRAGEQFARPSPQHAEARRGVDRLTQ